MLNLLFPGYGGKRYYIRDICSGAISRYEYRPSQQLHLNVSQHKRCLDILAIDVKEGRQRVRQAIVDQLDLDTCHSLRGRRKAISLGFTFKEYMEFSLYDSKIGYYTTRPGIGTDFRTKPMRHSPYYGMWTCEVLFQLWIKMIEDGSLAIDEPFHIVEGGAGTGIFARDIIEHAAKLYGENDEYHKMFYRNLFYLIIEISPELVEKQKETLSKHEKKCAIFHGDIRHLDKEVATQLSAKGFFLSNELPDAFSMHKIRRTNTKLQASIVFPVLKNKSLVDNSIVADDWLIRNYLLPTQKCKRDGFYISKNVYRKLTNNMSLDEIHQTFDWEETWVNGQEIEEIKRFIPNHHPFIGKMANNSEFPLNTDLYHFQRITSTLLTAGYKVTIDYQEDNRTILNAKDSFRCYPGGINHDFSLLPGTYDITADVNASSLAEEGTLAGWRPVFFGTERMLLGMGKHDLVCQLARERMNFKVVIEKKGGREATNSLPILSLPLTYRDLYVKKCDILSKIFNDVLNQDQYTIAMVAHNLYAALLDIDKPVLHKFGRKEKKVLKKINDAIHPLEDDLKKAIKLTFKNFLGKKSMLLVAKDYGTLDDLDLKKIAYVFDQTKTSDKVDYLAFLIIRQVLQMYYFSRHRPKKKPAK